MIIAKLKKAIGSWCYVYPSVAYKDNTLNDLIEKENYYMIEP